MVVTPADEISVQALYRMRSARQRLAVELPEGAAFDTQPLRINGRPATLEKGRQSEYFVPLAAANADKPFLLELRYTLPGDGSRLDLPAFPEEPAVVKAYLCVYLPETRTLLGVRGPWTEEFRWQCDRSLRWQPSPQVDAERSGSAGSAREFAARPSGRRFPDRRPAVRLLDASPGRAARGLARNDTVDDRWLTRAGVRA